MQDDAGVASERAFSDGSTASRAALLASNTTLDWVFRSGGRYDNLEIYCCVSVCAETTDFVN